ncbi:hypothetical protein TWF694_001742 [Orbilia ellipsospora]|uniref:Uncharacterized protein n=1 Tax=Orbilia ellipsospora TaxID=2528407 RepID=A0AAV9X6A9_9PEZI
MKFFSVIILTIAGTALAAPAAAPVAVAEPAASTGGYVYCYQCEGQPRKTCLPYIPIIDPCRNPSS